MAPNLRFMWDERKSASREISVLWPSRSHRPGKDAMRLILLRLSTAIPNLIAVVVVTFLLTRLLPGDPAAYFAGPSATAASIDEIRHRLALDRSLSEQFVVYVRDLARGDLGNSLTSGQRVVDDLRSRLPASLELTVFSLLLASAVGLPLGAGAALRPSGPIDSLCSVISVAGQAIPTFFLGLLLVYVFYYLLGWAPAPIGRLGVVWSPPREITGFWSIDAALAGDWPLFRALAGQLALPVVALAMFSVGPLARVTRSSLLDVLSADFVRTARAAGLPGRKVILTYALRNALIPVLNASGMVFSYTLGATVLVEKVFGWPGVGAYAIDAVLASDFAPVQGFVLAMATLYLLLNLLIDAVVVAVDPRVRFDA
jgi:ABC-type dipeptide/oligopeptide/nickel transport system permease component